MVQDLFHCDLLPGGGQALRAGRDDPDLEPVVRGVGPGVCRRRGADGGDAGPGAAPCQRGDDHWRELPAEGQAARRTGGAASAGTKRSCVRGGSDFNRR
jgi:hypothetical protein